MYLDGYIIKSCMLAQTIRRYVEQLSLLCFKLIPDGVVYLGNWQNINHNMSFYVYYDMATVLIINSPVYTYIDTRSAYFMKLNLNLT